MNNSATQTGVIDLLKNTEVSKYQQQALDFLNATNTTMEIKFKEFGLMPWDKDGQKRNIFEVTISNHNHNYTFDFGSSIKDSCGMESKMSQLIESDEIIVYAGLKSMGNKPFQAGINITLTKYQLLNTDYELLTKYFDELERQINSVGSEKTKKAYELFDAGKISRDQRDSQIVASVKRGLVEQCVKNAIKRRITELETEQVFSKSLQGEENPTPSEYDVLACLNKYDPYSFEDFCSSYGYDEDSRSAEKTYNAVCEEWQNITLLFSEEQIEQLAEIN